MKKMLMVMLILAFFVGCANQADKMETVREKYPSSKIFMVPDRSSVFIVVTNLEVRLVSLNEYQITNDSHIYYLPDCQPEEIRVSK